MSDLPKNTVAIKKTLRLYIGIIVRDWKYSVPISICVALGSILVFYIPPLFVAQLIARQSFSLSSAWQLAVGFGVAWMVGELLWRLAIFLMIRFEIKTIRRLYSSALASLMEKDIAFFSNRFSGTITKNLLAYARRFEGFFDTLMFEVMSQFVPALFAAVILFFISPWLSIALVGMMTVSVFCITPLIRRRVRMVKEREDAHAAMSGHVSDVVSNIAAVKSFGSEIVEQKSHDEYINTFISKAKRSWDYQNMPIDMVISPLYVMTNVIGLLIVMSLSVDAATKANLFLGFSYYSNVTRFMWSFNSVYRRLEEAITEASLFVEYTLTPPKITDAPDAAPLKVISGDVTFDNVDFTHAENNEALFRSLTLSIPAGQKVGLVGHSGAGKTTIANLLLRFVDIDGGDITIDSQSISKVTQESLHQSIAYVPQEPILFHRTLRKNICYGKLNASDKEVIDAAVRANAYEFIQSLPKQFDTLVGERGVKLSGGQRQRIAIARAILKDAPILILDEATSALDSESEKLIQESLGDLMQNRTSIVIAHRLSTIAKLDRIIVLDNGKIAEDGTHSELLANNGIYAKLWSHQSGGFIEE